MNNVEKGKELVQKYKFGDSIVPLHSAHTKNPEESIGKEIEYLFDNNMIELTNG